ncbi:MAG TPA: DUF6703 family protein [Pilimelia sp.]|nr:DUF6703 family protein [Pilimelia sp.]
MTSHDRRPSGGLAERLARLNLTVVFLATIAYLLVALLAPGIVGGALLLVLAAALIWLMALTWPVTAPRTRIFRLVVLTLLVAVALFKIL